MIIALTGATGFVGRHVQASLAKFKEKPVLLVRKHSGLPGEVLVGDLGRAALESDCLRGAAAVLHLAGRAHIIRDEAADPIEAYRRINVDGTRSVVKAAIAAGVPRFVFMSSVKAVGERTAPGEIIDSFTTPAPEDSYGISKLEAENQVREICDLHGVEWVILRPPLVYGPGVKANLARLIALVARGAPLPFGAVRNRRSFVYVQNLADAAVLACHMPQCANRILTLADATLSTPELLHHIAAALRTKLRLFPLPVSVLRSLGQLTGRSGEVERLVGSLELDPRESLRALDWEPTWNIERAMKATVGKTS